MINRRLLRIKVLQVVYAHLKASREKTLDLLDKELLFSVERSHDVYIMVFKLLADMGRYAESRVEQIDNRLIKSQTDALPYKSLANNRVLQLLIKSKNLDAYKAEWIDNANLVKKYTEAFLASEEFIEYQSKPSSLEADKEIITWFLAAQLLESDEILDYLEDNSMYWNDELDTIVTINVRTIEKIDAESADISIQKAFRNDDDKDFARRLLRKSVFNFNDHNAVLEKQLTNWDVDRIAEMDLMILHLAITEAMECPSIPTKVTLDEFIEIAKLYSTEKSNTFINGILDVLFKQLQADGTIVKIGRGLTE